MCKLTKFISVQLPSNDRQIVEVRASDRGLTSKLKLFSVYCTSLLCYRLQFAAPSGSIKKLYNKAAQRSLCAPWNAMPMSLLCRMADLSFPFEVAGLER